MEGRTKEGRDRRKRIERGEERERGERWKHLGQYYSVETFLQARISSWVTVVAVPCRPVYVSDLLGALFITTTTFH